MERKVIVVCSILGLLGLLICCYGFCCGSHEDKAETMDDIDSGLAFFGTFDITKMNNGKAQLPCLFMHMRILEFVWHLNLGCGLQVFSGIKRVSQKPTSVSGASGIRFSSSANLSYMYILQQYSCGKGRREEKGLGDLSELLVGWKVSYYCYLVWPGVFAGAAMLSLATVMLNIVYYLVLYLAKNKTDVSRVGPAAAAPNQAGIALGQAQFPPPNTQAPVFVHEDTYMRRQFP
ncbi:hypothetical protein C3L33_16299, partial [Rhododendron williamsianum]